MDVTVYQPPPQTLAASSLTMLGQFSCSEPSLETSKVDGDAMFFSMPDIGLDFASTDQFCAPRPPQDMSKVIPAIPHSHHWRADTHMAETHQLPWSFSVGGLGDDGCTIPPIAAPTLPQRMLPSHFTNNSPSGLCHPLDPPSSSSHPYWPQATELPNLPASQDGGALLNQDGAMFNPTSTLSVMQQMFNSDSRFTSSHPPMEAALRPGMSQQSHQSINQTQLAISGNSVTHNSPSPPGSKSATPSPSSSAHEDENEDTLRLTSGGEKRPAAADLSKKSKTPKKKKRKDPNEPVKPVSAYALFFRDTQASIKAQNPNATFGEVSKVVASMWDGLGDEQKQLYKKRTEVAKKEYLKQLAAYRATLVLQSYNSPSEMKPPHSSPSSTPKPSIYPSHQGQHPTTSSPGHPHCLPYSQHTSMYLTYPHPSQHSHNSSPGLGCQTPPPQNQIQTQLLALSPRGMVPHPSSTPHQGTLSLSSITAASTAPLQVSPPVHNHTHSGRLPSPYQQLSGYRLGVTHSPAVIQSHQPIGGAAMCSSMDYRQLSRHTPNHQPSPDWCADYHGNSTLQREKHLYQS